MNQSGGVAAAFGFRYQYLVTIEELLELYETSGTTGWRVGVDLHDQDSADILVFDGPDDRPSRAIQVKASMPTSATKMDLSTAQRCLEELDREHPGAGAAVLVTNRVLNSPATQYADSLRQGGGRRSVDTRSENARDISSRLLDRIAGIRDRGKGGLGRRLHQVLLSQLVDLVLERGSQVEKQLIDHSQVAAILDESTAVLADASGARSWGRVYGMPTGVYVPRPQIEGYLAARLTDESNNPGVPTVGVLSGLSGSGKSAAVASWAARRREHYALSVWLDAASDRVLQEQTLALVELIGGSETLVEDVAQSLCDALSQLPVPWLLILDGASSFSEIRRWIPASGYGHVVITTGRRDWPIDLAPMYEVDAMNDGDSIALIRERLPVAGSVTAPTPVDDQAALDFASRFGRWPIALDLACAWVRGLGGDYSRLAEFTSRLDRLDLMDGSAQLAGYPKRMGRVIDELWDALPEQSRAVLAMLIFSGGAHVPILAIERWSLAVRQAGGLEVDPRAAVEELVGSALANRRLRPGFDADAAVDEALYVHEGIQAALAGKVGAEARLLFLWLETNADMLKECLDGARLTESTALFPSVEGLLRSVIAGAQTDADGAQLVQAMQLLSTTIMHNLGMCAWLCGLLETASKWLRVSINFREHLASDKQRNQADFAIVQIQSLGMLAQVDVRREDLDEIQQTVAKALDYLGERSVDELEATGQPVAPALRTLASAMRVVKQDPDRLVALLEAALEGSARPLEHTSELQDHVARFGAAIERAKRYSGAEQWSRAVDVVLVAANQAVDAGILEHEAVDAVLDVGASLVLSRVSRRLAPPSPTLTSALRRLIEWGAANAAAFNSSNQTCWRILVSVAEADGAGQDLGQLRQTLYEASHGGLKSSQIATWTDIGQAIVETIEAQQRVAPLLGNGPLPPDLEVIRRIDGGQEVRWWVTVVGGRPVIGFVSVSAVAYVGDEVLDPLKEYLKAAGFPDHLARDDGPQFAPDWSLVVQGRCFGLLRPDGECVLMVEAHDPELSGWWSAMERVKTIRVIYSDAADTTIDELLETDMQAIVAVVWPAGRGQGGRGERRAFFARARKAWRSIWSR